MQPISSADSTLATPQTGGNGAPWGNPFAEPTSPPSNVITRRPSPSQGLRRPLPNPNLKYERYVYTYRLLAGPTPMQIMISVEPQSGRPTPGKYTFRLSFKANGVERPLCEPVQRVLSANSGVDPRQLEFVVFVFPGKTSLPTGCLWSLRIWLRVNGIDHRLFGEDEMWIGKDPDFNSIGDASFARLKQQDASQQTYNAFVGRALISFVVRWARVTGNLYSYSLEYEAGGVGNSLFEDYRLRLDGDPRTISFLIFTVPSNSVPAGASHKLRVWLRSQVPLNHSDPSASYVLPFNDSYIYQRIWKTDDFKIGAHLNFDTLGPRMVMGFSSGSPETVAMPRPSHHASTSASSVDGFKSKEGYDF